MRNRLRLYTVVLLALCFVSPSLVHARVTRARLPMVTVTTGVVSTFTTSTIFTRRYLIQADVENAATIYIGDSDLDATSEATLSSTCLVELRAGESWSPVLSVLLDTRGELFRLSDLRVSGSTGDKARLNYERQIL